MKLEILGSGCAKCKKLEEMTRDAVREMGVQAEVAKVQDIKAIMAYGVMVTPALVVDGEVKLAGRLPSPEELKKLIGARTRTRAPEAPPLRTQS
ncbi:MAG: thioredoxin family protein [Spirochaetes bacterium]|nr:MAG: thioredoxin family protein [Spirochaetota bacterium]